MNEQQELFTNQPQKPFKFNGDAYDRKLDQVRLTGQIVRVYWCMKDEVFRTLDEISAEAKAPHASVSAQLRHLRKERFGGHTINKRPRGDRKNGLFEYQMIVNPVSQIIYERD